jgi:cytosine deaminase
MNHEAPHWPSDALRDVIVPVSVVASPDRFGGVSQGDGLRGQAVVENGCIVGLANSALTDHPKVLLPKLVEPHCHLDKCHSIWRMGPVGGDLTSAIAAQMKDKAFWTEDDLRHRMARGLDEAIASGCGTLRSHIDWSDTTAAPTAWQVIRDLATDHDRIEVQYAALTGIDQMADSSFCTSVAETVAQTGGVLGSFILYHDQVDAGLRNIFAQADRLCLALDFHVDEGLGAFNGLEKIADIAIEVGFEGPILCGHAVSLLDRSPEDFTRISDKLARAGIAVCALPTTNLYLQGRKSGTPDRRGITRLQELREAGVPILIGSDNVGDAFCPLGAHDPMAALHLASLVAHLDPPFGRWLPSITTDACRALGLEPNTIETTPVTDLLLSDATHLADVISGRAPLYTLKQDAIT